MDINKICMHCMNEAEGQQGMPCPRCGHILGQWTEVTHQLKPMTILQGKYLVGEVLGEGGFGITYIGFDLNLEIKVAIKEFYPNGYATREAMTTSMLTVYSGQNAETVYKWRENFLKEARSLGKCSHLSGVVGVRDFFQENNTAYIVLEYLEGMTLKKYAGSLGGRIPASALLPALEPVLAALGEVHKQGLIHRDISPDNIMLLPGGQMKLLDFGAAREYAGGDEKSLSVMLKPGYAPEEQYRSRGKQGPWSDIYALAGTIYKCLTGVTPPEAMERMRSDELRRPNELGAGLGAAQEAALMKAMAVFAEERYQTIAEFQKDLYAEAIYAEMSQAVQGGISSMPAESRVPAAGQAGSVSERTQTGQQMTGGIPAAEGAAVSADTEVLRGQPLSETSVAGSGIRPQTGGSGSGQTGFWTKYKSIFIGAAAGLAVVCMVVLVMSMGGNSKDESSGRQEESMQATGGASASGQEGNVSSILQDGGTAESTAESEAVPAELNIEACRNLKTLLYTLSYWATDGECGRLLENNIDLENTEERFLAYVILDRSMWGDGGIPFYQTVMEENQEVLNQYKGQYFTSVLISREQMSYAAYSITGREYTFTGEYKEYPFCESGDYVGVVGDSDDYHGSQQVGNYTVEMAGKGVWRVMAECVYDFRDYWGEYVVFQVTAMVKYNPDSCFDGYSVTSIKSELVLEENVSDSQFKLPDSDKRFLTMQDLEGFTQEDCRIARNEIYARYGRRFSDEGLQAYFDSCDWYVGTIAPEDFDDTVLNEYETANRDLIVEFEQLKGYR